MNSSELDSRGEANQCFLKLAGHLFPNLLTNAGQLRYSEPTTTEGQVAKKSYRSYLKTIHENTGLLLEEVKDTLEDSKGSVV